MKKILKLFLVVCIFFMTGCGTNGKDNILKNIEKKLNDVNSYYLEGEMEIINNEDSYQYDVKVSYQKDDYYRIELVNKLNNHEQVILKNDSGVYVDTQKSYKLKKYDK